MRGSEYVELEALFLALGDKTRLRLLALMADGPVAVGLLADKLGESQPKVSRHLAYLRNAGVVYTQRDGKHIYYGIERAADDMRDLVIETVTNAMGSGTPKPSSSRLEAETLPEAEWAGPDADTYDDRYLRESRDAPIAEGRVQRDEIEIFLL